MAGELLLDPDGAIKLAADGSLQISDGAGDECCCNPECFHVAPVRRCSNDTLVTRGGNQVYNFCEEGSTAVITWYSEFFRECLYADCSEATDICEDVQLDVAKFLVDDCEAAECNLSPPEPCSNCPAGTTPAAVRVTFAGLASNTCCDTSEILNPTSFKLVGSLDVSVLCLQNPGDPCSYYGEKLNVVDQHEYNTADCTTPPAENFASRDLVVSVSRTATGWTITATLRFNGTTDETPAFSGSVAAANCTAAAVAGNTVDFCTSPFYFATGGGTATITPVS
jgi:hypothetical protein